MEKKWFYFAGFIIFIWWLVDLLVKLRFYGEHDYLWFCSVALLILAIGFFFRSQNIIVSFLAIAAVFQLIWIFDSFSMIFFSKSILGETYVFSRGEAMIDFLVGLRHFIMVPIALVGLKFIKKPAEKYSRLIIAVILTVIGMAAFFLSDNMENINCSLKPCGIFSFNLSGFSYSIFFLFVSILVCAFIILPIVNFLLNKAYENKKYMKILNAVIIILFAIGIFGLVSASVKYSGINHVTCGNNQSDVYCERVDFSSDVPFVQYYIKNNDKNRCNVTSYFNGNILNSTEQSVNGNIFASYMLVSFSESGRGKVYLRIDCTKI